jgi:inorganic pyrophosphatase
VKNKDRSLKYQLINPKLKADEAQVALRAVVETPRGSRHKFALDPDIGAFVLKQTLASGLTWPYDYGFIPCTLGKDGDPLDVIVLMDEPTFPGCVLTVRLLGVIGLEKNGIENNRFVGCLLPRTETSLSTDGYATIGDLPAKLLSEVKNFLCQYSEEEGNRIELTGDGDVEAATTLVQAGQAAFDDTDDD